MAISALTVWEVRSTGADTNGGGFVAGASGTDFSQQTAAQVVIDNSTIVCSTPGANSNTLTFVSGYTPSAADIGNIVQILSGGTNVTAGFYQITAQTSTTWTLAGAANLTTAGGAGSAITGNMGGCLATPAKAGAAMIGGNRCWIKNGTYTGASGPLMTLPSGAAPSTTVPWTWVSGYNSTRGDITHGPLGSGAGQGGGADNRPILQATNVAVANVLFAKSNSLVDGLIFDLNGLLINGYLASSGNLSLVRGCLAKNVNIANAIGFLINQIGAVEYCESVGTASLGFGFQLGAASSLVGCHAHGTLDGVELAAASITITECLIDNNGRNGIRSSNMANCVITKNTIVGNTGAGIENSTLTSFFPVYIKDNIIADNGGAGIKVASASGIPYGSMFDGNTFFGNVGGNVVNTVNGGLTSLPYTFVYDQLATIDPVVSHAAGGNFAPAVTTPGPIGKTWLSQWPGNTATTNYADMGAVQHQDTGGGIAPRPFIVPANRVVNW
jgi:parallel beta-helix repeat protein